MLHRNLYLHEYLSVYVYARTLHRVALVLFLSAADVSKLCKEYNFWTIIFETIFLQTIDAWEIVERDRV